MRAKSLKRQKLERDCAEALERYRQNFPYCQMLGCQRLASEVHHIFRGPNKVRTYCDHWAILHLCNSHHRAIEQSNGWTYTHQLALKAIACAKNWNDDPFDELICYDREAALEVLGQAEESITVEDVAWAMEELLIENYSSAPIEVEMPFGEFRREEPCEVTRLAEWFWRYCDVHDIVPVG